MSSDGYMKWLRASSLPWRRRRRPKWIADAQLLPTNPVKRSKFDRYLRNQNLDIFTKRVSLKVSTSVVSVEYCSGEGKICRRSGFIMESTDNENIVLTTASVLSGGQIEMNHIKVIVYENLQNSRSFDGQIVAYNLHLDVAAISIQLDTPLPSASSTRLRDCITVDPSHHVTEEESLQRHPNPSWFDLIPGDVVIAVGRYLRKPYSIMAAPGVFSIECCEHKEFLKTSCEITKCGIGGPLINRFGEVIGICLHKDHYTEFLPINIASMWWEHYKKYGKSRHLLLGIGVANLYATPVILLEKIIQKFPGIVKGVIVEEVVPGSSAQAAGIKFHDVIIQIDGKEIGGVLELYETMWNKVGESVEVVVVREKVSDTLHLTMVLDEARSDQGYEPSDAEPDSESEDDDSNSKSLVESDDDEEEDEDGDSEEEKGKTWEELEKEASYADKEKGNESDSEDERRRKKNFGTSRAGPSSAANKRTKIRRCVGRPFSFIRYL